MYPTAPFVPNAFFAGRSYSTPGAVNYYVDSVSGSDSNSGLTPNLPWQTIGKINGSTFNPGDIINFKCGSVFNGTVLTVPSSGSASKPIVFRSYGVGAAPIFKNSITKNSTGNWTDGGSNSWSYVEATDIGAIYFNGSFAVFGKKVFVAPSAQGEFQWDGSNLILYSVGNPATFYSDIILTKKANAITCTKDYVTFQNLHIREVGAHGISIANVNGNIIQDCTFQYIGGATLSGSTRYGGAAVFQSLSATIQNCLCQRNFMNQIYDDAFTAQGNAGMTNMTFRNNIATKCWLGANFSGGTQDGIYVYNNTLIDNSLCWSSNQRTSAFPAWGLFFNNSVNVIAANNIVTDSSSGAYGIYINGVPTTTVINSNVYYTPGGGNAFHYNATDYTFAQWTNYKTASGQDSNSFITTPNLNASYVPVATSSAIGSGATVASVTEDYNRAARIAPYDIGAVNH